MSRSRRRRWQLGLVVVAALGGCRLVEPQALSEGEACPADFETCQGSGDCFARCVCETGDAEGCAQDCERGEAPRVSDLDEGGWPSESAAFEAEVLARTNDARAEGGCCGDEGCFAPSAPLAREDALQSAARAHALDMAERGYFAHESPEGLTPFDRMREAGYRGCALGENIAAGQTTPREVVDGWLASPGHCANMLQGGFRALGVGHARSSDQALRELWVQAFGG